MLRYYPYDICLTKSIVHQTIKVKLFHDQSKIAYVSNLSTHYQNCVTSVSGHLQGNGTQEDDWLYWKESMHHVSEWNVLGEIYNIRPRMQIMGFVGMTPIMDGIWTSKTVVLNVVCSMYIAAALTVDDVKSKQSCIITFNTVSADIMTIIVNCTTISWLACLQYKSSKENIKR